MADSGSDITPEALVGLWRRDRIEFSDGRVDATTQVFWGQTCSLYIDIRIPVRAAALAPKPLLADYAKDEHLALAEQKGFAGHIRLAGNRCEWVRLIDYQPATGRPDVGEIRLDGDILYEQGDPGSVLGSAYSETFKRISRGSLVCAALQLIRTQGSTIRGLSNPGCILLMLDDWFLFAEPRAQPLPPASNLAQLVAEAPHGLACSYLDCEYSFGHIRHASCPWQIELSTLPSRVRQRLLPAATAARHGEQELSIDLTGGALSWRIIESNLPPAELASLFLL